MLPVAGATAGHGSGAAPSTTTSAHRPPRQAYRSKLQGSPNEHGKLAGRAQAASIAGGERGHAGAPSLAPSVAASRGGFTSLAASGGAGAELAHAGNAARGARRRTSQRPGMSRKEYAKLEYTAPP